MLSLASLVIYVPVLFLLEPLLTYVWDSKKLRRFPNYNKLAGITTLGYILERWRGFRSRSLHAVHEVHPIVRVGPNSLSFSTPSAIRAIYGHSTPCIKGDFYLNAAGEYHNIFDAVDKADHARKRRLLSHAFATRNLVQWEYKVNDKIRRMVTQFDRFCGEGSPPLDYRKWSNLFTIEAIADIAVSQHLGCIDRGDDLVTIPIADGGKKTFGYIDCMHDGRRATSTIVWASRSWFPTLRTVLNALPGWFRSKWKKDQLFNEMVRYFAERRIERFQQGEELDDLVSCLLTDKQGEPRSIPLGELIAEITIFRKYTP
jgi:cytochrome P450